MKIKYSKFEVDTSLELPLEEEKWHDILMDEFFRHHIYITTQEGKKIRISKEEVFLWHVQELLSKNEERATEALRSIIFNREQELYILKKALY